MGADLTLPGDLPGLLRRSSPVLALVSAKVRAIGRRALVEGEHPDTGLVMLADGALEAASNLRLDLTDPTGRIHLLWWAERGTRDISSFYTTEAEEHAIDLVRHGRECTEADIIALRGLGLRIAGRTE